MKAKEKKLIARGAILTEQIKALETELKSIKEQLDLPDGRYSILGAELLVVTSERSTLDSKLVKGFLTPAQVVEATKTSSCTTFKFRSLPLEAAA